MTGLLDLILAQGLCNVRIVGSWPRAVSGYERSLIHA